MPKHRMYKHKQFGSVVKPPIVNCLECENCQYIGEGDYLCDVRMKIIISDHDLAMSCRRCGTFVSKFMED